MAAGGTFRLANQNHAFFFSLLPLANLTSKVVKVFMIMFLVFQASRKSIYKVRKPFHEGNSIENAKQVD